MGGKSHADNKQIVEEQKRQADEAKAKEAARQARLDLGLKKISNAFDGKAITKATTHNFDWKTFNDKSKLPAGYKRVQLDATGKVIPGNPAQAATTGGATRDPWEDASGRGAGTVSLTPGHGAVAATPASTGVTGVMGPDGKIHKSGQAFNYTSNDPTGQRTGGFDDQFYNDYINSITGYYDPQLAKQYGEATDQLTYRLADAGTLRSSAGNKEVANLAEQNATNSAEIGNKANLAAGDLKAKVANERAKATSQLYATENPDVAANQATAAVRDLSLGPDLSPLAQLFNIAAVGGANIMKSVNNRNLIGNFQSGIQGSSGHIIDDRNA